MNKYFEMRNKDFLIQEYTRYGFRHTAVAEIKEAFEERNDQFRLIISNLLFEIGIPEPEPEEELPLEQEPVSERKSKLTTETETLITEESKSQPRHSLNIAGLKRRLSVIPQPKEDPYAPVRYG